MTTVFAMIPARAGSKGLPNKNVAEIGGHPLVAHAAAFADKLDVDRVIISTDSEAYARAAHAQCMRLFWHNRGAGASSDTAMEEDIIADYVDQGNDVPDIWVWLKPTSPFRSIDDVQNGIRTLVEYKYVDSVRLVTEADARLQVINELGWLEWISLAAAFGRSKMRRTEVPKVYKPFNLEIFRHRVWRRHPALFMGTNIHPVPCAKITGLDIDGQEDLDLVRALVELTPRPDWLKPYVHL